LQRRQRDPQGQVGFFGSLDGKGDPRGSVAGAPVGVLEAAQPEDHLPRPIGFQSSGKMALPSPAMPTIAAFTPHPDKKFGITVAEYNVKLGK